MNRNLRFCGNRHGHIATGDLKLVENPKLRNFFFSVSYKGNELIIGWVGS